MSLHSKKAKDSKVYDLFFDLSYQSIVDVDNAIHLPEQNAQSLVSLSHLSISFVKIHQMKKKK